MDRKIKIVASGQNQTYDAVIDQVQGIVEANYAEELMTAGMWKRVRIRRKLEKEIRERMERIAPKSGLY